LLLHGQDYLQCLLSRIKHGQPLSRVFKTQPKPNFLHCFAFEKRWPPCSSGRWHTIHYVSSFIFCILRFSRIAWLLTKFEYMWMVRKWETRIKILYIYIIVFTWDKMNWFDLLVHLNLNNKHDKYHCLWIFILYDHDLTKVSKRCKQCIFGTPFMLVSCYHDIRFKENYKFWVEFYKTMSSRILWHIKLWLLLFWSQSHIPANKWGPTIRNTVTYRWGQL
jgi:hypothetical protein